MSTAPSEERLNTMMRAVELGVDRDDFLFASNEERLIWSELEIEFEQIVAREGVSWAADLAQADLAQAVGG